MDVLSYTTESAISCDDETLDYEGPPAHPLEFPKPIIFDAKFVSLSIMDQKTAKRTIFEKVLMQCERGSQSYPEFAYALRKKVSTSHGRLWVATVLQRQDNNGAKAKATRSTEQLLWQKTERLVLIQVASLTKTRKLEGRRLVGPLREVAAMQHIGNYSHHVMGCLDVLQDDYNLYTVLPYVVGISLRELFVTSKAYRPKEETVCTMFKQLLRGLLHLQQKGVCHRNISLENVYFENKSGKLMISNISMSLRVPYDDPANVGGLTDVSEGTHRRLIWAHDQNEHSPAMYQPPEVLGSDAFDGFAADLWSSGVLLFVMLVGMAPFKVPHKADKGYAAISCGRLKHVVRRAGVVLSPQACDLLQNMLWPNPQDRLSLAEVMRHPWVESSPDMVKSR